MQKIQYDLPIFDDIDIADLNRYSIELANAIKKQLDKFGNPLNYKGAVLKYSDLPNENNINGDIFTVNEEHKSYIWNGKEWVEYFSNGPKGDEGRGIKSITQTYLSPDDEGTNTITILYTDDTEINVYTKNGSRGKDGKQRNTRTSRRSRAARSTTEKIGKDGANGKNGNGITSIDVTPSIDDDGNNVIKINFSDGTSKSFNIKNGSKGTPGVNGKDGENGTDGITPTIEAGTVTTGEAGTKASVTSHTEGTTTTFDFTIPKGANGTNGKDGINGTNGKDGAKGTDGVGITSIDVTPSTADGGNNVVTINLSNDTNKSFNIKNGTKGSTGPAGTTTYSGLSDKPKLNTNNTSGQVANSSETISGTINLHKVSKTGSFKDLNNIPNKIIKSLTLTKDVQGNSDVDISSLNIPASADITIYLESEKLTKTTSRDIDIEGKTGHYWTTSKSSTIWTSFTITQDWVAKAGWTFFIEYYG